MTFKSKTILWMLLLITIGFSACKSDNKRPVPEVDHIAVDISPTRFEKIIANLDTNDSRKALLQLRNEYPGIFSCFAENITEMALPNDTTIQYLPRMADYLTYPGFQAAIDSTFKEYPDIDFLKKDLTRAFQYYQYHFPNKPVPGVFTFVSEYRYGAVTCFDSLLGIGLDFYLGKDFTYYPALGYPKYIIRRMDREHMVRDAMMGLVQNDYGNKANSEQLIDRMIFKGKLLYFLDMTLPYSADSIKIGYQSDQIAWCEKNEEEIWSYFLDKDRLYITNRTKASHFVTVGPSTMGMPPEAPGNIGSWVGWQIVRKFMAEYPDVTFEELMQRTNGQKILQLSGYRP